MLGDSEKMTTTGNRPAVLIRQLCQIASRGGNYLLNVGPNAEGLIPQPSVERMAQIGQWLSVNSEAVNGTNPSPFPYELPWGLITTKPGKVYLHVFDWPKKELVLYGLQSHVSRAYLLTNKSKLKIAETADKKLDHHTLTMQLPPAAPDKNDSVIVLEVAGQP